MLADFDYLMNGHVSKMDALEDPAELAEFCETTFGECTLMYRDTCPRFFPFSGED